MPEPDGSDKPKPRTGRVRHDAGGRAIWEWAIESGKYAIDSTSRLLKKLDLSGITLVNDEEKPWEKPPQSREAPPSATGEDGRPRPRPGEPKLQDLPPRERGFNPYDTRTPVGRGALPQKGSTPPRPRITQPPPRKRGFLARLLDRLFSRH